MAASSWKLRWAIGAAVSDMCLFIASANAQNPQNYPTSPPPGVTAQKPITPDQGPTFSVNQGGADHDIAEWLAIDNQGEVAMAKLAEAKAVTPAVRQFSERMEQDHTKMLGQLRPFEAATNSAPAPVNTSPVLSNGDIGPAPNNATTPGPSPAGRSTVAGTPSSPAAPGTAGTPSQAPLGSTPTPGSVPNSSTVGTPGGVSVPSALPGASPAPPRPTATAQTPAQGPQAWAQYMPANADHRGLDFLEVMRQIGRQHQSDAVKLWDTKKSADAEIAYIGEELAAHQNYIETSKVLRLYASPRLQGLIDQSIRTAGSHLAEATQVMQSLVPGIGNSPIQSNK